METKKTEKGIFVTPRVVASIDECDFYHTMEIPGHGVVQGKWDLREGVDQYLGGVNFKGKRVFELGTASGFLCFEMEKRGAEVVAHDIGEDQEWDMVPFCQYDYKKRIHEFKEYCNRLKNAYWYAHNAYNSKANVVYGSVYDIPKEIDAVDIGTFCSILLHLRDPFLALQSATRLVKDTVIVTDLAPNKTVQVTPFLRNRLLHFATLAKQRVFRQQNAPVNQRLPYMEFLPNFGTLEHKDAWWSLSTEIIINFLGVLGFEETKVTYHTHELYGKPGRFFTVVGKRTCEIKSI